MVRSQFNQANLTASTKTANIMAGDVNEFVTEQSEVTIYAISSASGVRISVFADGDLIVDDKELLTIGTSLIIPDNMLTSFSVDAGTRLAIYLRETAGASTTDVLLAVDVD